jgi:hypothetical protein
MTEEETKIIMPQVTQLRGNPRFFDGIEQQWLVGRACRRMFDIIPLFNVAARPILAVAELFKLAINEPAKGT